ncbi:MAG TPA: NUDIX hydrolase [Aliidongia sp.]|nr:NUDIX hydrolase [Aliidongia sp.]
MKRDYPNRPIVGILAVVRRGDRFLLVRRGRPPNQGRWGFPGGVQELGESIVEAALRELAEETSIAASAPGILTALDAIDRDEAGAVRYHYTLVAVALTWGAGEGEAGDDADALGWFGPDELDDLPVLPAVRTLMLQALEAGAGHAEPASLT